MHNACNLQKLRPSSRWGAFLLTHLIFMGQIRNRPCRHRIHLGKTHEKTALGLNFWCSHAAKVVLSCVVSVGISYTGVWAQSLISATSAMSADMNLDNWFLENALILSTFRGLYEVYNRGLGWVQDTSWYIIIYIYIHICMVTNCFGIHFNVPLRVVSSLCSVALVTEKALKWFWIWVSKGPKSTCQPKVLPRFPDAGECQQVHHHFHGGSAKTSDSANAFI